MFPTDIFRTDSFRLAVGASLVLLASMAAVFGLVSWQSGRFENRRIDRLIAMEAHSLAAEGPATIRWHVERHYDASLRSVPIAAIFDRTGRPVAGDLARFPAGLPADGRARLVDAALDGGPPVALRAVAVPLPGGGRLVIGRNLRELAGLRAIVVRALALGFAPAFAFSLAGGALTGWRNHRRIRATHQAIDRIVAGGLHERLPARSAPSGDDLDRLARSVNRMLERLERLVGEVRGVGDDIAHDLRTPLARVRASLDRTRRPGADPRATDDAIDRAIVDLDRVFAIITALLRINAIETEQRRVGFADLALRPLVLDALDFYEPIADAKNIALRLDPTSVDGTVRGDADLLAEAIANLLDNAIKFTGEGGHVSVLVARRSVTVIDDGIGLDAVDRGSVLKRFYRADRSRHVPGNGLGLSLVAAIAELHDAAVRIAPNEPAGSRFSLDFRADPTVTAD